MYEYRCKILRIVDGDTVDVDIDLGFGVWMHRERVRIMGIDTPESRTRDLTEKKFGLAAKEFVRFLMPVGSSQIIMRTNRHAHPLTEKSWPQNRPSLQPEAKG